MKVNFYSGVPKATEKLGLKPRPSRTAFDSYSRGSRSSESRVLIFLDTKEPFNHCILKV